MGRALAVRLLEGRPLSAGNLACGNSSLHFGSSVAVFWTNSGAPIVSAGFLSQKKGHLTAGEGTRARLMGPSRKLFFFQPTIGKRPRESGPRNPHSNVLEDCVARDAYSIPFCREEDAHLAAPTSASSPSPARLLVRCALAHDSGRGAQTAQLDWDGGRRAPIPLVLPSQLPNTLFLKFRCLHCRQFRCFRKPVALASQPVCEGVGLFV